MSEKHLRYVKNYLESDELTERQRETIQRFDKHKVDFRHWKSIQTRLAYAKRLNHLGNQNHKPYEDMTEEDIINFLDSKNFAESTRNHYIICFRTFFAWLYGLPEGKGEYPDCIKNFKTPTPKETITKSMLITDQEKIDMIRCAGPNYRDAAIVTVLPESMFRPSEFLSMNIGDVVEKPFGFSVSCPKSKTYARSVPLVTSARYLAEYLNHHPHRDNPESPLWISFSNKSYAKRLALVSLIHLVHRLARRAGIKKRVYPYLFRHTGATYLALQDMNEAKMRILLGWSRNSPMPSRYTHLAGVDVEDAVLELHGIKKKPKTQLMASKFCPRCDEENGPEMTYCGKCATNLDFPLANMSDYKELLRKQEENQRKLDILMAERYDS